MGSSRGVKGCGLGLVLVLAPGLASGRPANPVVDELPVIARLEEPGGTRFVLRGALVARRRQQMTHLARAVQRDVSRRLLSGRDHSGLEPVELCLFETTASYRAFVSRLLAGEEPPSELGFYSPQLRVVVANLGLSTGNLRHEMAHALVGDDYPDIPSWLTEGIGALYGSAELSADGSFRFLVNYRLRHLRAARREGKLPGLRALAESTPAEVYGPDSGAYYGLARYLLFYLDRRARLPSFLAELRAATTPEKQRVVLERHVDFQRFLAWTDTL